MSGKGRIVVTGGAGFIGSHIARRFASDGYRVVVLDDLSTGSEENVPPEAEFLRFDVGEASEYRKIGRLDAEAVFHLAAQSSGEASFDDPERDMRSHVLGTFRMLQWCRERRVGRFLYSSSMAVYGEPDTLPVREDHPLRPLTYYAAGKVAAEAYVNLHRHLGVDGTVFRLFSVYGPGQNLANRKQGIVSIFLSYMLDGEPVPVKGPGERFRDLTHVDDVVDAWRLAYGAPASRGKTYNLATGRKTTVHRMLDLLKGQLGDPAHPVRFLEGTPGDQFGIVGDGSRIREELGWTPAVDIETGIERMFRWGRGVHG